MNRHVQRSFIALIVTQTLHSLEESFFGLYAVFPPARLVSRLISSDLAVGFAVANTALVLFACWCYLARVSTEHPSSRAWAWGWTALEAANGSGHLVLAAARGGYFPGAATAPLLLGGALWLGLALRRDRPPTPNSVTPR